MKITKIEAQKNNKNRVNLYLDENFYCGLSLETILKNGIKQGKEIDSSCLEYLRNETEKEIALNNAVGYISKAAKTKKQIRGYLLKKGFEEDTIFFVLKKLEEYNFVNDELYAKQYVKFKTKKNGKNKILMELKLNGVSEELARDCVENFANDKENIVILAEKYLKNKNLDLKTKQKTYRYLLSKGYEMENIFECLNKFFKNNEEV